MPKKESSDAMSSLAAHVMGLQPKTGRSRNLIPEDENTLFVPVDDYNGLLHNAKRLAGSVMSQDETTGNLLLDGGRKLARALGLK